MTNSEAPQVAWRPQRGPQTLVITCPVPDVLTGGARGGGKLSPVDSLVCTPMGWKRLGDVVVGDQVTDPVTGGATEVIGVFPQGVKPVYRITCDDGASMEAGLEHLWLFKRPNHIRPGTKPSSQREYARGVLGASSPDERWANYRIGTTAELAGHVQSGERPRIPLTEPVAFTTNGRGESDDSLPAYTIGLMLGDGSFGGCVLTTCDDEIRDYATANGFRAHNQLHSDGKPKSFGMHGETRKKFKRWLYNHKLGGAKSWSKRIPPSMLTMSIQNRVALLQGLMDTDGTVDARGRCYFDSTSEGLAGDVVELVRGLGGKAFTRQKSPTYTYKGQKMDGRTSHSVLVWLPKSSAMFRLSRKKARCSDSWNGGCENMRAIESITYVGEKECVCIRVDSPYGLYLGNDYIVTHNTETLIGDAAARAGRYGSAFNGLFLRRTITELADVKRRMFEVYPKLGATWAETRNEWKFPGGGILLLAYLDDDRDADRYQGRNITALYVDEVGNFPSSEPIDKLWGALRSAEGVPAVRRMSCNPGGVGHAWVHKRYIKGRKPGEVFEWQPQPKLRPDIKIKSVFIPSRLEDNEILMRNDPTYELRLAASGNPALYRAWRYGDWDVLAGGYFDVWDRSVHVAEMDPQYWWEHWLSIDWGFTHDSAIYWYAYDGKRVHVYQEFCQSGYDPVRLALEIVSRTRPGVRPRTIYISHDAFGRRTSERSIALDMDDVFVSYGWPRCIQSERDRVNGWQAVYRRLAERTLVVSPGCVKLIELLPTLVRDPNRPEDILKVDGDDPADSLRYGLAALRENDPEMPKEMRLASMITSSDPHGRAMQARLALSRLNGGSGYVPRRSGRLRFAQVGPDAARI